MKTIRFTVEGRGDFPDDMLRYACAWPATSLDVGAMVGGPDRRSVTLETDRGNKHRGAPLSENVCKRFASFGWRVVTADGLERNENIPTGWSH